MRILSNGGRMIKQLLNSEYRDLTVSCRSIICLGLRLRQIIDQLAGAISRYFAQTRPMIVNCCPLVLLPIAPISTFLSPKYLPHPSCFLSIPQAVHVTLLYLTFDPNSAFLSTHPSHHSRLRRTLWYPSRFKCNQLRKLIWFLNLLALGNCD